MTTTDTFVKGAPQENGQRNDLERRIQVLEDIAAIEKFKAEYALRADLGRGDVMELFADDATLDAGPGFGGGNTRAEITQFYENLSINSPFCLHHIYNPSITIIDESNAEATWLFRTEAIIASTGKALVLCGHYYDKYVKVGNDWKYKSLLVRLFYATEPSKGWAEQRWALPVITELNYPVTEMK